MTQYEFRLIEDDRTEGKDTHTHICGAVGFEEPRVASFDPDKGCGYMWEHNTLDMFKAPYATFEQAHNCPKCGKPCERYQASKADIKAIKKQICELYANNGATLLENLLHRTKMCVIILPRK